MWLVLGDIMATPPSGHPDVMQLVSIGTSNRRLIGLLKKFRTRVVRRLMSTSWLVLVAPHRLVISCVETGLCLVRPPLRWLQGQNGEMMATCPVEVCPSVLTTTNRLTSYLPIGVGRSRTMNVLVLCIDLLNCMQTLEPVQAIRWAGIRLMFKSLVILLVSLGNVCLA